MVGIFMPAYNQGKYIDDAIKSLRKQTFQDFVVHIVDDGSDDGETPEKLKSINYEKAEIFLPDENKGVAARAREHYKMFKTKYVLVFCADDVLAPTFLERTVEFLEKNPKCAVVSTNIIELKNGEEYEHELNEEKMTLPHMLARCNCLGSSLMRKKALDEVDFSGGFKRYQDWDRYVSMFENGWKAGLISEHLFYYRQHGDSLSHSASIDDEMDIKEKMLKKHAKSYGKYYDTVILDLYHDLLEVQSGKNWLDDQYYKLNTEIKRLNNENKELKEKIDNTVESKIRKKIGIIKAKVRGK